MIPQTYKNSIEFRDAFHLASQCNWNKKELEVYEYMSLKAFDEINALRTAERKGMEKGMEKEKLAIAKNMIKANIDMDTITLTTGLDKKLLSEIMNDYQK